MLKNCLFRRKKDAKPKPRPKNVAIVVGHTQNAQGATAYDGQTEYSFNSFIAAHILKEANKYDGLNCRGFSLNNTTLTGLSLKIREEFDRKVDLVVELHFNGFKRPATGTEILVLDRGVDDSEEFWANHNMSDMISDMFEDVYGFKQRHGNGVKLIRHGDRGRDNLRKYHIVGMAKAAMLIEPTFMNFKSVESTKILKNPKFYAEFLADALFRVCLGLKEKID